MDRNKRRVDFSRAHFGGTNRSRKRSRLLETFIRFQPRLGGPLDGQLSAHSPHLVLGLGLSLIGAN